MMKRIASNIVHYFSHWWIYIRIMAKWTLVAGVVGTVSGLVGSAFHIGVEIATEFRGEHPWMLYLLPVAGLLIVVIYKLARAEKLGTNNIIEEVQLGRGVSLTLLPAIFAATVLTHLCGGSAGREGAALQMGGTIGYQTGRLFRLDDKDIRMTTMMGMAALFSALFGTPLAATIFALEVISIGLIYHAALVPCFLAALVAYGISLVLGVRPTRFPVYVPAHDAFTFLKVAVLAILCALVAVLFCGVMHLAEHEMKKYLKNPWLRVVVGGAAVIALTLLVGTQEYNGAGVVSITRAVGMGETKPLSFLLKILFTAITLAAGFKGGEVVPSFFVGATFGALAGPLLGIHAGFAAAIGLVSVFCGAVNCPIASIFLAIELFGTRGALFYTLACGISFVLSGYSGLYSSQRILYSKLKMQYIDVHTNAHHAGEVTEAERAHPVKK